MKPAQKKMHELRKDIKGNLLQILEEARNPEEGYDGTTIEEFPKIIYSTKARAKDLRPSGQKDPEAMALWVIPFPHTPTTTGVRSEQHDFTFFFVVFVYSRDLEKGKEEAEHLSAKVYDVLSENRGLNCNIYDVIPGEFDPAYDDYEGQNVYWAGFQMNFRVRRLLT